MVNHETQQGITNNESEPLTLGQFLTQCRERLGMSPKEAAKKVGISLVYLERLEDDRAKNPSLSIAFCLAETYGVSVEALGQAQARKEEYQITQKIQGLEKVVGVELLLPLNEVSPHTRELYLKFLSHLASSQPNCNSS
ncbi:hypothetical protein COU95_01145 [Candidatus Shapirobacteria bacterium CG10_big_fil_rev_8_21_14_0_10_40_9]|uniref:HTH cro/C1-type domain-containing protein n=1 Tax=Candidatus Shapirobacteria bacterium CG10_big_fil_rev_8_21_14_0_10_40_9 TaxID=1974888 RepID=A0A2M8L404_9BACT|nr:MAG: hypothetical protein COU95_01145 [Candidatus Shapirobacteria bacterium CG10_big_fil_rev_8_21_14_0_10_40_9]